MRPLLLAVLTLSFLPGALPCHAQGGVFRVATEGRLPLSIAQEADNAIDRAQRWLATQPPATNDLAQALLRRYALAKPGETFRLRRCHVTPLGEALPGPIAPAALTNLTATLARKPDPKTLFALQRDLPAAEPPPPADWRERLALALIDSQRVSAQGGHWGAPEPTAWAILTLRALLNESTPIQVEPSELKTENGER